MRPALSRLRHTGPEHGGLDMCRMCGVGFMGCMGWRRAEAAVGAPPPLPVVMTLGPALPPVPRPAATTASRWAPWAGHVFLRWFRNGKAEFTPSPSAADLWLPVDYLRRLSTRPRYRSTPPRAMRGKELLSMLIEAHNLLRRKTRRILQLVLPGLPQRPLAVRTERT